jgi:putative ABC transport system substrate-binding protein
MRRREFIALLPAIFAAESGRVLAQSANRRPRVGVLVSSSPPHPFADAFRRGLHKFGYVEGKNITLEFRYTGGRYERAAELAVELVQLGVDIIVAHFTPAVKAALAATRTVPIVMAPAGAPLQVGFVDNLARPGGNVTGLSGMDAEIGGKRLQLLRELIPNLASVGVLASTPTTDPYSGPYVADLSSAAAQVGVRLEPILVSGPSEFEDAFAVMARAGAQAVIVQLLFDPQHRTLLLKLAAQHRLAFMSGNQQTAAAGALVSISADYLLLYERAASFVDKIIKGAKPGDLPVEQPTKFQVVINAKTARKLGLNLSPTLVAQTDQLIE